MTKKNEFLEILDFILNRCNLRQIDAVEAAVQRRKNDLSAGTGLSSLNPERLAAEMNKTIQNSLNSSMSGMRHSIREYAAGIIEKEAPELTDAQMEELLDAWIPENLGSCTKSQPEFESSRSSMIAVPADVQQTMILQFTAGCLGTLSTETSVALQSELGSSWAKKFWDTFSQDIRSLIKARVQNGLDDASFHAAIALLLQEKK